MRSEPAFLELLLTKLAFFGYGKKVYKSFADRLPLSGGECVLDFGCGMGTVAFYTARKLTNGSLTCADISTRWLKACRKTLRRYGGIAFLQCEPEAPALPKDNYDIAYCHFVLHDIPHDALQSVINELAGCLKQGGSFVFREPLSEAEKLSNIKRLLEQNGLSLKDSRVIDVPMMGNALESVYAKSSSLIVGG